MCQAVGDVPGIILLLSLLNLPSVPPPLFCPAEHPSHSLMTLIQAGAQRQNGFQTGIPWALPLPRSVLWGLRDLTPSSPRIVCFKEPHPQESAKETRDTKFTRNLRTKFIQYTAETPPMLAPGLLGSRHPRACRLRETEALA